MDAELAMRAPYIVTANGRLVAKACDPAATYSIQPARPVPARFVMFTEPLFAPLAGVTEDRVGDGTV